MIVDSRSFKHIRYLTHDLTHVLEQVEEQAKVLAKGLPFKTALVVGGDAMPQQIFRIKQGVELIIGTPGRLIDLFIKHEVDLQVHELLWLPSL